MNEAIERPFEQIRVGDSASFTRTVTPEMEDAFRAISGDRNPLHYDDGWAASLGYRKHVAFGMLTASLYSTMAGMYLPGRYSLIHSLSIKFQKPVYAGDTLTVHGVVADKQEALRLLCLKVRILNQAGKCVSCADMKVLTLQAGGGNA